jgi:transcriptional regulator GlxA family with amidase domain
VLLAPADATFIRYEDMHCLDLEWTEKRDAPPLQRFGPIDCDRAFRVAERMVSGESADFEAFADTIALFREVGAPLGSVAAETLRGGPSDQDLRIARAIEGQVATLRSAASALSMGELADLSPRQLQRLLADYCKRYRMNGGTWREMRNRYRLQIAIVLLSTSMPIAEIADEVGYASSNAFSRALSNVGLPTPTEVRTEIARLAPS